MLHYSEDRFQLSARTACFLMAALTVARGSSFLLSKQLLGSMEPLNLLGLRFFMAFLILFILFLRKVLDTIKQDPGILVSSLLLGATYYVCMAAELIGLQYTTSSTCSFLENTAIVMVPMMEAILLRRKPKGIILLSTSVTVIGIALIVRNAGEGAAAGGFGIGIGEGLCIVAAIMYAAAIILTDRLSKRHEPMTLGILYVGYMGALGLVSSYFTETPHLPQSGSEWLLLVGLAVLCTCFGFTMQPVAQKPISSETAGIICALNPLTTAVLGWILLGDALAAAGILGAALILGGIVLPNLRMGQEQADAA